MCRVEKVAKSTGLFPSISISGPLIFIYARIKIYSSKFCKNIVSVVMQWMQGGFLLCAGWNFPKSVSVTSRSKLCAKTNGYRTQRPR